MAEQMVFIPGVGGPFLYDDSAAMWDTADGDPPWEHATLSSPPSTSYAMWSSGSTLILGTATAATGSFTDLSVTGNTDLGNAITDSITVTGRFDSHLIPITDSLYDLGATGPFYWRTGYIDQIYTTQIGVEGDADLLGIVDSQLTVHGAVIITGDTDLGNAITDSITCAGRFDSSLVPITDSLYNLGATGPFYWANAFIDQVYTDQIGIEADADLMALTANRVTVNGDVTSTSFTIGANILTTVEWANLDGQDQTVATGSSPTFVNITGTSFIIGGNTLDTNEWAFLDGQDQTVAISSTPTFVNLLLSGATIGLAGDTNLISLSANALTINGTTNSTGNVTIGNNAAANTVLTFDSAAADGILTFVNGTTLFTLSHGITVTGTAAATTVTGANVTSGGDPGHTHTGASLSGIDISDDTNLAVGNGINLTDDTLSVDYNTTNLKITGIELNTIQDIATGSSPQFARIGLGTAANADYEIFISNVDTTDRDSVRIISSSGATPSSGNLVFIGSGVTSGSGGNYHLLHLGVGAGFATDVFYVKGNGIGYFSGDLIVNGGEIGITADTDLLSLAANALTVNGTVTTTGTVDVAGVMAISNPSASNTTFTSDGWIRLDAAGDLVNAAAATTGGVYHDAGGNFIWRDVDAALATRMTLFSATGNLTIGGDFRVDGGNIGITADTNLLSLTANLLTVSGGVSLSGDLTFSTSLATIFISGAGIYLGESGEGYIRFFNDSGINYIQSVNSAKTGNNNLDISGLNSVQLTSLTLDAATCVVTGNITVSGGVITGANGLSIDIGNTDANEIQFSVGVDTLQFGTDAGGGTVTFDLPRIAAGTATFHFDNSMVGVANVKMSGNLIVDGGNIGTTADTNLLILTANTLIIMGAIDVNTGGSNILGPVTLGGASDNVVVEADGDVLFVGGGGLHFADMYVQDSVAVHELSTTKIQVTGFTVTGVSNGNVTPDHSNDHITLGVEGMYLVTISITAENDETQAHTIKVSLWKNNGATEFANLHCHRRLSGGAGDVGSLSLSGIIDGTAADTLEIWASSDSGSNKGVIFQDITMSVVQIGGT